MSLKLVDYRNYCQKVFLTEETLKDILTKIKKHVQDETEASAYERLLRTLPGGPGHWSLVTEILLRSRKERETRHVTMEAVQQLFQQYIFMLSRNIKLDLPALIRDDKVNHPDGEGSDLWTKFEEAIHMRVARLTGKDAEKMAKKTAIKMDQPKEEEIFDTRYPGAIYKDENIEVYEAKTPAQCKMYETHKDVYDTLGRESPICLKYPANFWGTYRIPYQSGFYFVFPRGNKWFIDIHDKKTKHAFIVVESRLKGDAVWTYPPDRMMHVRSIDEIISLFPFMAPIKHLLVPRPADPEELGKYRATENQLNDTAFIQLSPELKDMYIANGHDLSDKQWNVLTDNQKHDYVNFSQSRDLTDYQLNDIKRDSQLFKRYMAIKIRNLQAKITSGQYMQQGISKHESMVMPQLLSGLDETTKQKVVSGVTQLLTSAMSGSRIPRNLGLFGIYKLFKGQILASTEMQSSQMLNHITDLLSGIRSKTSGWSDVSNETKKDIYDIANDVYSSNEQILKPTIMAKIEKDPQTLLKGLISIPTPQQIEYFNLNEKELLSDKEFSSGLDCAIEGNLSYGTDFPPFLKQFWSEKKQRYIGNAKFMEKMKNNLMTSLYGKLAVESNGFRPETSGPEGKEVYDLLIGKIRKDIDNIRPLVQETIFDQVFNKSKDINQINSWGASSDFIKFCKEHEKELKKWLTFKLIDTPPEHLRQDMVDLINEYREFVLKDPVLQGDLERRLISDIITNKDVAFRWSGDRIDYWMNNFDRIMAKYPKAEDALIERIKSEYGTDRTANAFYTEYGIPLSFYKKHENDILSDPEAKRGLKQKIIDELIWRDPIELTDEEAIQTRLSSIERDFVANHSNDPDPYDNDTPMITPQKISTDNR